MGNVRRLGVQPSKAPALLSLQPHSLGVHLGEKCRKTCPLSGRESFREAKASAEFRTLTEKKDLRMTIRKVFWLCLLLQGQLNMPAEAQGLDTTLLLMEDFNTCVLPAGWQVRLLGDTLAPLWYVGLAQTPDAVGQSIDGTCFFFIDGSTGGKQAPAHVLELISPPFSFGAFTEVECRMDVHFKFGDKDVLEILAIHGSQEHRLALYDNFMTNDEPLGGSDNFRFRADLAFLPWTGLTQLVVRYTSPAGSQGRYAGIDNIRVTASGSGAFAFREAFDGCSLPAGWESEILSGPAGWSFGFVPLGSSAFYQGNSMNGTCFAYFDDNAQGDAAAPTHIRLRSPWFSGTAFLDYELTFDAIMRYSGAEAFAVYLETEAGDSIPLFAPEGKVSGPFFPNYGSFRFDLSPYRSLQWRLTFEYRDGGTRGYWVGLDNVKVVGRGAALDFCEHAVSLSIDAPCIEVNNRNALYSGPADGCQAQGVGSVWFYWIADYDGPVKLTTGADFNDAVSVFEGDCSHLSWVLCTDRDEHGFTGETAYFQAEKGKKYFVCVSGTQSAFGLSRGTLCVRMEPIQQVPATPPNDVCAQARSLAPDVPCPQGTNRHADMSSVQPSHNRLARADVWYSFYAPALAPDEVLLLDAQANFSHLLTVYKGTCTSLVEVATNSQGSPLRLPSLAPGQVYYAQVAGVFATAEGDLCPVLRIEKVVPPFNNTCAAALPVALNAPCAAAGHSGATFSGQQPPCAVRVASDVWFRFEASVSGAVRVNSGAPFDHVIAVWEGDCAHLKPVFCSDHTRYCDGSLLVPELKAGQGYYLQIAAKVGLPVATTGPICLTIADAALPEFYPPLDLKVNQLCMGKDSVRLLVDVEGGASPYVFLADTNAQLLRSGQPFGVVVRDVRGCEAYVAGVAKPCEQNACTGQLTFDVVAPSCYGATDGLVAAGISAGTGPFFFEWSNGVFTATNADLPAGTYTVVVAETTGCVYTEKITLEQPEALSIVVDLLIHPVSGQSNGAVYPWVSGGTPPWTYRWTDAEGIEVSTDSALLHAPPGTYTLWVSDAHGCTDTLTLTLTETVYASESPPLPQLRLFPNPAREHMWLGLALSESVPVEAVLLDVLGQPLARQYAVVERGEDWIKFDVRALPAAVYLLALYTPKWTLSRRVVVER